MQEDCRCSHPAGTEVSSLQHVLGDNHTLLADRGLFLEESWRMHPSVCSFSSELFYDGKLHSVAASGRQEIHSTGAVRGTGLRYLGVPHVGNKSSSLEEAEAVVHLVGSLLSAGAAWTDRAGDEHPLSLDDILIIAPYNAQVFEISSRLPGARVGTVDKFQGQEAPIAIYSMVTSSPADSPRGMEFL